MKVKKELFRSEHVDDQHYMSASLIARETFKDGIEFEMEGQWNSTFFTLYRSGVKELSDFLNKWLEENKNEKTIQNHI